MYDAWVPWPERPKGAKDKSRGPKGLELEVGARRTPKLLVIKYFPCSIIRSGKFRSWGDMGGDDVIVVSEVGTLSSKNSWATSGLQTGKTLGTSFHNHNIGTTKCCPHTDSDIISPPSQKDKISNIVVAVQSGRCTAKWKINWCLYLQSWKWSERAIQHCNTSCVFTVTFFLFINFIHIDHSWYLYCCGIFKQYLQAHCSHM